MKSITMAVAIAVISATLAACVSGNTYAVEAPAKSQEQTKKEAKKPEPKVVEVQPGDTLTSIAEANGVDWPRLFNANEHIGNPDNIHPGDKITIPAADAQLAALSLALLHVQTPAQAFIEARPDSPHYLHLRQVYAQQRLQPLRVWTPLNGGVLV